MSDVVVWSAGMVIPITAPSILDGAVAVRDGRIEHVGARDWVINTLTQRGFSFTERHFDGVLLPGLVNAHTHLQYTGMASVGAGQYRGFDDWARAFDEVYDAGGLDWGGDAAAGARLLLASGTTAAADVVTDADAASALHDAGLHGVAYWEVMGWSNEEWRARGEREVSASLDAMPTPPAVGISPHAPYSLDAEPLLDLPDMARRRGMRIHIHLGESHSEAEWSETRTTTLADLWKSEHSSSFTAMRSRGGGFSSTQFVDQLGVLGPDCHVAHGVYMRADDLGHHGGVMVGEAVVGFALEEGADDGGEHGLQALLDFALAVGVPGGCVAVSGVWESQTLTCCWVRVLRKLTTRTGTGDVGMVLRGSWNPSAGASLG